MWISLDEAAECGCCGAVCLADESECPSCAARRAAKNHTEASLRWYGEQVREARNAPPVIVDDVCGHCGAHSWNGAYCTQCGAS